MTTTLTFDWVAETGSTVSQKPNVKSVKFGDGYEVRTPVGINNNPESWTVQCTMTTPKADAALAFIKERGGVESFYWTSPHGVKNIYICREWRTTNLGQARTLSFTLEQVFEF